MPLYEYLVSDFEYKDTLLRGLYEEVSPYTFYEELYCDKTLDDSVVVTFGDDHKLEWCEHNPIQKTIKAMSMAEAIEMGFNYANMYLPPCTFFNNYNSSKCMENLYAIVVDFDGDKDGVSKELMDWLIKRINDDNEFVSPTFLTNSGHGLHLWYVFDKPLPMYASNKRLMRDLYAAIHQTLNDLNAKPQRHHITQAYRIVGSKTKINTVTTAFRTGDVYDVNELLKQFGVNVRLGEGESAPSEQMMKLAYAIRDKLGVAIPDEDSWKSVHEYIAENKDAFNKISTRNPSRRYRKADGSGWGSFDWYKRMKDSIILKTPDGHRYTSLMAFMIIGYKCNIPFDQVKRDEDDIILKWQMREKSFPHRFNDEYRDRIDNCYSEKYLKVTKEQLEDWLGFEMHSSFRRNGRNRELHMKIMSGTRDILHPNGSWRNKEGAPTKEEIVRQWRKEHPTGKKIECERDTGLSRHTVLKYWNSKEGL